jgi:hypothetical protein
MKTIKIGFSKSKKFLAIGSWVIREYMDTSYSHTYLVFTEEDLIYEAVGTGTRFISTPEWENHAVEVKSYRILISDQSYLELKNYCESRVNVKYGFWQNLGIVIAEIFKLKKNPFNSGLNCSESVGRILIKEGYVISKNVNLLTPEDIYKVLESYYEN